MAFDSTPRFEPPAPIGDPPTTWEDRLDFVCRALVLLPLAGLYAWWIWSIIKTALTAFTAA